MTDLGKNEEIFFYLDSSLHTAPLGCEPQRSNE